MAYFANGTEGMRLEAQCDECPLGDIEPPGCMVRMVQDLYNYTQLHNEQLREAMGLLISESDGICEVREGLFKAGVVERTARDGS